jgi:transposase
MIKKRGKPYGAKQLTEAERDVIRLGLRNGQNADQIAAFTGRGRATIYKAIAKIRQLGTLGQEVIDLGQIGGRDDSAGI